MISGPASRRSIARSRHGARRDAELAVLRRCASRFCRRARAMGGRNAAVTAARRRRCRLPGARQGAGRGRLPQGGGAERAWRAAPAARRPHALPGARNSRMARRARRFRLRDAGPRHRLDFALRLGRTQGALPAAGARRPRDRGVRAVGAGGRLRRRGARHDRHARRPGARPPRRPQDLDLERRHRRSLRGVCPQRRRPRRARPVGVRGRRRHARPVGRRAHRGDRAASARHPGVRRRAGAGRSSSRQSGRRLQGRDGDARHLPLDRRRRRARLRAPGAARDASSAHRPASCSARRSATCS